MSTSNIIPFPSYGYAARARRSPIVCNGVRGTVIRMLPPHDQPRRTNGSLVEFFAWVRQVRLRRRFGRRA